MGAKQEARDKELDQCGREFSYRAREMVKEIVALRKILVENGLARINKYGQFTTQMNRRTL